MSSVEEGETRPGNERTEVAQKLKRVRSMGQVPVDVQQWLGRLLEYLSLYDSSCIFNEGEEISRFENDRKRLRMLALSGLLSGEDLSRCLDIAELLNTCTLKRRIGSRLIDLPRRHVR